MGALLLSAAAFSAVGVLVSVSVEEVFEAQTLANMLRFPMIFLGSVFVPVSSLPQPLGVVARLLPFPYGVEALRFALGGAGGRGGRRGRYWVFLGGWQRSRRSFFSPRRASWRGGRHNRTHGFIGLAKEPLMLEPGVEKVEKRGLRYRVGNGGKVERFNPWLGDLFSRFYVQIMEGSVFPRKFGADLDTHYDILAEALMDLCRSVGLDFESLPDENGALLYFRALLP